MILFIVVGFVLVQLITGSMSYKLALAMDSRIISHELHELARIRFLRFARDDEQDTRCKL
jgi:hypothetical protein